MTRLWTFSKARNGQGGNGQPPPPSWAAGDGTEVVAAPIMVVPERYVSRRPRPVAQLVMRAGLWGAVALGCLGGVVGLFRAPAGSAAPVVVPAGAGANVPAPVARIAELVAEEWLTATEDDEERLGELFLEPPSLEGMDTSGLSVGRVTAIAGRELQEGYWAVTVEVEVTESVPVVDESADDPAAGEEGGAEAAAGATENVTTTWFLDVPIVGHVDSGLAALTTPAVLVERPEAITGWRPSLGDPGLPGADDPTAATVDGFLDALLAGAGDPGRYVAPGVEVAASNPPLFADIEVMTLAIDQTGEQAYRVLAEVSALMAGGGSQRFSYELMVVERVDRLEITQFSGAPTLVAGSPEPESESEPESVPGSESVPETAPPAVPSTDPA